jgi:TfoX/Sxy family transcriptional regulator of competence genes
MAYDEALAGRVRDRMRDRAEVTERKMFGGLVFLAHGAMTVGVYGEDLLVRVDPREMSAALAEPGVRPFTMGERTTRGFVSVARGALDDRALDGWIERADAYVASLPPG